MKSFFLFFSLFFSMGAVLMAQETDKVWVYLKDKSGTEFSLDQAGLFLSEASIERRNRQGISPDWYDLPVSKTYLTILENAGIKPVVVSRWLNAVSVQVSPEQQNYLLSLPFVREVVPVKTWRQAVEEVNTLPLARSGSTESVSYGGATNQVEMIELPFLHEKGYRGQGMVIAVLDGGFLGLDTGAGFTGMFDKGQILGTYNFPDNNEAVYFSSLHGTYVTSIMGVDKPGTYVGASPDASYYLFRTEVVDSERVAEEDFWLAAAEYADVIGVDIINSSLGYTTFDVPEEDHTYADMDGSTTVVTRAADLAASRGILVCNSAGNSGNNSWLYIGAPADGDSVFSIGAVDPNGIYATFSSIGPTYDGRIKPNIAVQGASSAILSPEGIVYIGNGTSFSSPLAAGAAACLWQAFPEKTNMEIMQAMEKSASRAHQPDEYLGYGIPNMLYAYYLLKGIDLEEAQSDVLGIFPNPVSAESFITIQGPVGSYSHLTVYDQNGRTVLQRTLPEGSQPVTFITWPELQQLPRGIYTLSLYSREETLTPPITSISFLK